MCILVGRLQSNKAEFIRVSSKISAVNVKEFLIRQHCNRVFVLFFLFIEKNNMIFFIVSIARYFDHGQC